MAATSPTGARLACLERLTKMLYPLVLVVALWVALDVVVMAGGAEEEDESFWSLHGSWSPPEALVTFVRDETCPSLTEEESRQLKPSMRWSRWDTLGGSAESGSISEGAGDGGKKKETKTHAATTKTTTAERQPPPPTEEKSRLLPLPTEGKSRLLQPLGLGSRWEEAEGGAEGRSGSHKHKHRKRKKKKETHSATTTTAEQPPRKRVRWADSKSAAESRSKTPTARTTTTTAEVQQTVPLPSNTADRSLSSTPENIPAGEEPDRLGEPQLPKTFVLLTRTFVLLTIFKPISSPASENQQPRQIVSVRQQGPSSNVHFYDVRCNMPLEVAKPDEECFAALEEEMISKVGRNVNVIQVYQLPQFKSPKLLKSLASLPARKMPDAIFYTCVNKNEMSHPKSSKCREGRTATFDPGRYDSYYRSELGHVLVGSKGDRLVRYLLDEPVRFSFVKGTTLAIAGQRTLKCGQESGCVLRASPEGLHIIPPDFTEKELKHNLKKLWESPLVTQLPEADITVCSPQEYISISRGSWQEEQRFKRPFVFAYRRLKILSAFNLAPLPTRGRTFIAQTTRFGGKDFGYPTSNSGKLVSLKHCSENDASECSKRFSKNILEELDRVYLVGENSTALQKLAGSLKQRAALKKHHVADIMHFVLTKAIQDPKAADFYDDNGTIQEPSTHPAFWNDFHPVRSGFMVTPKEICFDEFSIYFNTKHARLETEDERDADWIEISHGRWITVTFQLTRVTLQYGGSVPTKPIEISHPHGKVISLKYKKQSYVGRTDTAPIVNCGTKGVEDTPFDRQSLAFQFERLEVEARVNHTQLIATAASFLD